MILQIIGIGLSTAVLAVLLKKNSPELSLIISLCGACVIFLYASGSVYEVFLSFSEIVTHAGIDTEQIKLIVKIIGVAYIGTFAAALCKDAGEEAVGVNIELCTKVIIMIMSMPIITSLFSILTGLMG